MKAKLTIACVLLVWLPSCNMLPNERVAILEEMLTRAEGISTELDKRLADVETVALEAQTALADVNIPPEQKEQMAAILSESLAQIEKISGIREEYTGKITALKAKIEVAKADGVSFGEELQLYAEGVQSVAGKIPGVGGYVTLASVVLAGIGGVMARKRGQQRDAAEGGLTEVVKSVDKLLADKDAIKDVKAAKLVLKSNQPTVRNTVDAIRA